MLRPTLNIWCAKKIMRISTGNSEVVINPRELLFLIEMCAPFYVFKTERGDKVKINIKAEEEEKIERIF